MKKCSKCGQWKDKSEFYKNVTKKDGLTSRCKTCVIVSTDKKTINARRRENYKNPEVRQHILEGVKRRRNLETARKWKKRNHEKIKIQSRRYYLKNSERVKAYQRRPNVREAAKKKRAENGIYSAKMFFVHNGINPNLVDNELLELKGLHILLLRRIKKIKQGAKNGKQTEKRG